MQHETDFHEIQETGELSRRNFLKMGTKAMAALAAVELGAVAFVFLQARSLEGEFGGVITAGEVDGFMPGSVTEFPAARFFLICSPDGGFLAVHNRCPHLGCTVNWVPEKNHFLCPCHASTFDFYGNFENRPVPRPLDTFQVHIQDGKVLVDTADIRQRAHFSPEQLVYA